MNSDYGLVCFFLVNYLNMGDLTLMPTRLLKGICGQTALGNAHLWLRLPFHTGHGLAIRGPC